jgi:cyclic beta-1,2-glucan synthetase
VGERQYETDRCRFIGRGRTVANPAALDSGSVLSGTVGPVLDPVFCLRQRVRLKPGGSATISLATAVASTRAEGLALADQYRQASAASRVFELAWAHSQIEHRHSDRFGEAAHLFQRLAAHVLFAGSALRADRQILASNTLGQEGLWTFGISGDRPIVVARFGATDEIHLARELLAAQTYLHGKGLELDLVLLNDLPAGHEEELSRQLMSVVRTDGGSDRIGQPGGIFLLKAAELPEDGKILIQAAARAVLVGDGGSLASQLDRTELRHPLPGPLTTSHEHPRWQDEPVTLPSDLLFPNGLGGFTPDGREYCLFIRSDDRAHSRGNGQPVSHAVLYPRLAPAPWINVVANPGFGFLISESGSGYTWSQNSQANRLTPWSNDPVADPPGEIVYLRDEENGDIWSPTPLPAPSSQPTLVRHGQGYTTFEQNAYGLFHELTLLVAADDPVKLIVLRIQNLSDRPRRLSATYYAEWVVGSTRDATAMHVVTEVDPETGALLARNTFRTDFGSRVAFADVDRRPRSFTADRAEFVGRHGSMMAPAALGRVELSGATGESLDPCAAIQVAFSLEAGAKTQLVFLLGEAEGPDAARALIKRYREEGRAASALSDVKARWDDLL